MSNNIIHFAVKSIGLSRVNGRKPCTLLEAARHNLREIQAELGAKGHIDPARTHLNSVLCGPTTAIEVQAAAKKLLSAASIDECKLRRDHCQSIEAIFSLPQDTTIHDDAAYFTKCLAWITKALSLPVLSAVIHRDESAMHLHALLLPLREGVHIGSAPIDRSSLKKLRDSFFHKVAGPAGMKRTEAKMRGTAKHSAVRAVLERCEALGLPAANGAMWSVLEDAIKRDPVSSILALGIDTRTIRIVGNLRPNEPSQKPIGIASTPIGIQKDDSKHQTLSCVGFVPSNPLPRIITSVDELWSVVGCNSQWIHLRSSKLHIARAAQQRAITRHSNKPAIPIQPPPICVDEDGVIRVRDEYAHDISAWD